MAGLKFHHVKKQYDRHKDVVKDFHLEVADKEFLVLVGASGCGKSTILRMIAGLEKVSEGDIFIGDHRVNDMAPKDRDIAMVFQNYALYPHMNAYQNIAFGLKARKFSNREIDIRVREIAKILDIEPLFDRKPMELSGGQRQRVAIGRAIVREPQVFLMDEPLSNLDAKLRVKMRTEICRLHKRLGTTIIYVTHDQTEAMTMADRIVIMHEGVIQQAGTPKEIYDFPANKYIAGFIGSPSMNFIKGNIVENSDGFYFEADGISGKITEGQWSSLNRKDNIGKRIILGIRPEDILVEKKKLDQTNMKGAIDLIETTGAETYLYIKTGENVFTTRMDGSTERISGDTVHLAFNMKKAHFFDIETEEAIR